MSYKAIHDYIRSCLSLTIFVMLVHEISVQSERGICWKTWQQRSRSHLWGLKDCWHQGQHIKVSQNWSWAVHILSFLWQGSHVMLRTSRHAQSKQFRSFLEVWRRIPFHSNIQVEDSDNDDDTSFQWLLPHTRCEIPPHMSIYSLHALKTISTSLKLVRN